MNDTLIDLYKAVQKYRGGWQIGDRVHHLIRGPGIVMADYGTLGIVDGRKYVGVDFNRPTDAVMPADDPDLIWLPPVWSEDGRSLWAWVDWGRASMAMGRRGLYLELLTGGGYVDQELDANVTLPEALLRAIGEQEGEK